jgi:hypothetical protein
MRKIGRAVIVTVVFILLGCDGGFVSTPIGTVLQNPRDYEGKVVKISGNVTQSMNLLVLKYFTLKDNTGEIYVITDKILPKQGDSATVKGRVEEGFTIGPSQFIVIVEDSENSRRKE